MAKNPDRGRSYLGIYKRHPWWTAAGIIFLVLVLVIVFVLPPAIRWGIESWLERHGRLEAQVEDVDFNLFSGNLVVHSLLAEREAKGGFRWGRAALQIAWAPIFKKRISFDDISLSNARLSIVQESNGEFFIGGIRISEPQAGREPSPVQENGWEFGFGDIALDQVLIRYSTPAFTREILIREARIDAMQSWNPGSAGDFSVNLAVADGSLQIRGSAKPYGPQSSIQGRIQARDLPLNWAGAWLGETDLQSIGGQLDADTEFSLSLGEQTRASMDGRLTLRQVTVETSEADIGPATVAWQGAVQMVQRHDGGPRLVADGELTAQGPGVRLADDLTAEAGAVRIQGNFQYNTDAVPQTAGFIFRGTAGLKDIRLRQPGTRMTLARIRSFDAGELQLTGTDRFRAGSIELVQGVLLEEMPADNHAADETSAFVFSALTVRDILVDLEGKRIDLGAVALRDLQGRLVRNEEGDFPVLDRLPAGEEGGRNGESEKPPGGSPWAYAVGEAAVEDGALTFVDRSVDPAVNLPISNLQVSMEDLDSEAGSAMPIQVQADFGSYSSITAQGTVAPAGESISMDINGEIKQFSLPEVRGYAEQRIGYTIRSGQLYADFHLQVEQGRMDSVIKLFITRLDLNRVAAEDLGPLEQELGMPLNAALDLLRDGDGNIRLRLPVTGSLAQPDVDVSSIIAKAVRSATYKAVRTAALSYFAPLGAAYVAGKLFGKVVALRLNPIEFEPAQVQLGPDARQYLDQVVAKLKERPKAQLLICAFATAADRQALSRDTAERGREGDEERRRDDDAPAGDIPETRLLELAQARAENTRIYLVNQGIDSERLVLCAPEFQAAEDARPRVELAI